MKNIILITLGLLLSTIIFAQNVVEFTYDATGNRIKREFVPDIPNLTDQMSDARNSQLGETQLPEVITIYPNPATSELFVNFNALAGEKGIIKLINVYGQEVTTIKIDEIPNTPFWIDLGKLVTGVYHLVLTVENRQPFTEKVIISSKN